MLAVQSNTLLWPLRAAPEPPRNVHQTLIRRSCNTVSPPLNRARTPVLPVYERSIQTCAVLITRVFGPPYPKASHRDTKHHTTPHHTTPHHIATSRHITSHHNQYLIRSVAVAVAVAVVIPRSTPLHPTTSHPSTSSEHHIT